MELEAHPRPFWNVGLHEITLNMKCLICDYEWVEVYTISKIITFDPHSVSCACAECRERNIEIGVHTDPKHGVLVRKIKQ